MDNHWKHLRARLEQEGLPITFGGYLFGSWRYLELRTLVRLVDKSFMLEPGLDKFDLCKRLGKLNVNTHGAPERAAVDAIRAGADWHDARGLGAAFARSARRSRVTSGKWVNDSFAGWVKRPLEEQSQTEPADIDAATSGVEKLSIMDVDNEDEDDDDDDENDDDEGKENDDDDDDEYEDDDEDEDEDDMEVTGLTATKFCFICCKERPLSEFLPLPQETLCHHEVKFCRDCIANNITAKMAQCAPDEITCIQCNRFMPYAQLAQYTSPEQLVVLEERLSDRAQRDNPKFIERAEPQCNGGAYTDDTCQDVYVQCESCNNFTCIRCKEALHGGESCANNNKESGRKEDRGDLMDWEIVEDRAHAVNWEKLKKRGHVVVSEDELPYESDV